MTSTIGRPKNVFGKHPVAFAAWLANRSWGTPLPTLLDEGSALGCNRTKPTAYLALTASPFNPDVLWVDFARVEGTHFTPPTLLHRDDVPTLLEKWDLLDLEWAEGDDLPRAFFKGSVPRTFVYMPGPYFYLDASGWQRGEAQLHYDKRLVTAGSTSSLGGLIGASISDLGEVRCKDVPREGEVFRIAEKQELLNQLLDASARYFSRLFIDSGFNPARDMSAMNVRPL